MSKKASDKVPLQKQNTGDDDDNDEEMAENPLPQLAHGNERMDNEEDEEDDYGVNEWSDGNRSEDSTSGGKGQHAPFSAIIPTSPLNVLNTGAVVALVLLCAAVIVSLSTLGTQVVSRQRTAVVAQAEFQPLRGLQQLDNNVFNPYRVLLFGSNLLWSALESTDTTSSILDSNLKVVQLSTTGRYVRDSMYNAVDSAMALYNHARLNPTTGHAITAVLGNDNFTALAAAARAEVEDFILPFVLTSIARRRLLTTSQRENRLRISEINNIAVAQGGMSGMGTLYRIGSLCNVYPTCNASTTSELIETVTTKYTRAIETLIGGTQQFLSYIDSQQVSPILDVSDAVEFISTAVVTLRSAVRTQEFLAVELRDTFNALAAVHSAKSLSNATAAQRGFVFVSTAEDVKKLATTCQQMSVSLKLLRDSLDTWLELTISEWVKLGIARRFDYSTPFYPRSLTDTDAGFGMKYTGSPLGTTAGFTTYNNSVLEGITGTPSILARFHDTARAGYLARIHELQNLSRIRGLEAQGEDLVRDAAVWKIQTVLAISIVCPALLVLYVLYGVSLRLASSPFPYKYFVAGVVFCYGLHVAVCLSAGLIAKNAIEVPSAFSLKMALATGNETKLLTEALDAVRLQGMAALLASIAPGATQRSAMVAAATRQEALDPALAPYAPTVAASLREELVFSVFSRRDAITTTGTFRERIQALQMANRTVCERTLSMALRQLTIETMFYSWRRDELLILRQFQVPERQPGAVIASEAIRVSLCDECGASFPSDYCKSTVQQSILSPNKPIMYRVFNAEGREGASVLDWKRSRDAVAKHLDTVTARVAAIFAEEQLKFVQARRLIVWLSVFGIMLIQGILYAIGLRTFGPATSSLLP